MMKRAHLRLGFLLCNSTNAIFSPMPASARSFAHVTNAGSDNVLAYTIAADGAPEEIANSPFPADVFPLPVTTTAGPEAVASSIRQSAASPAASPSRRPSSPG